MAYNIISFMVVIVDHILEQLMSMSVSVVDLYSA